MTRLLAFIVDSKARMLRIEYVMWVYVSMVCKEILAIAVDRMDEIEDN